MAEMPKAVSYIELDVPYCANVYGTSPCMAAIPTTGSIKCFNSPKTCQDSAHYIETGATLRFAVPTEYLSHDIEAIPSISSISFTPAVISLGKDLGQRATLEIKFADHPDTDTGAGGDKYLSDRSYVPYKQGSFFAKLRARQPFLQGRTLRWIQGTSVQALADMEVRHFIVESFDGPDQAGVYTLIAQDVLKLADGDRAQFPAVSTGYLAADITAVATAASLLPSGIGNAQYPASGVACIGGNEVVNFTRSGDTLTLTRAQLGSAANTHKSQDRFQIAFTCSGWDVADLVYTILAAYANVPVAYMNLTAWRTETAAFLGNLYTGVVVEPTSVNDILAELIEQAALAVWWDDLNQQVRLQVLRAIVTTAFTFTADNRIDKTLAVKDQPDQRVSRVQTYFGQIDPTQPLTNLDNFRSSSLVIDATAETQYGVQALKTIISRWIPSAGRTVADRLGAVQLGRFRDPPRHVDFAVMRYAGTDAALGAGYQMTAPFMQDATGAPISVPLQVTQLNPQADRFSVGAEEMLFSAPALSPGNDTVIFDANNLNVNLRTAHDSIYPAPTTGHTVNFIINTGVVIGSSSTSQPAINVGTWPAGVAIVVTNNGTFEGCGGDGASAGGFSGNPGNPGGPALYTRQAITLNDASGAIFSGGGGGGSTSTGGGGGGGAGVNPGNAGVNGAGGTTPPAAGSSATGGAGGATSGGGRGTGGAGGGPGLSGASATGGPLPGAGGAAGNAIDGVSYISFSGSHGDIRGGQVN